MDSVVQVYSIYAMTYYKSLSCDSKGLCRHLLYYKTLVPEKAKWKVY